MSDRKVERLINLTIALLATKRYLTKSEIFSSVAGYEGAPTTMERMFERDKDELRSLGIDIEVGTIDNYFEDELGYRISQTSYGVAIGEMTPSEISYISLAAGLWRDNVFGSSALRALSKLSDDSEAAPYFDPTEVGLTLISEDRATESVVTILEAIEHRRSIEFDYESNSSPHRKVEPYLITVWGGDWYLLGRDIKDGVTKNFKLNRFTSSVTMSSVSASYEIPEGAAQMLTMGTLNPNNAEMNHLVALKVRKGSCLQFRAQGNSQALDSEWDLVEFVAHDLNTIATQVLWQTDNVQVVEPEELTTLVRKRLFLKLPGGANNE